jgi:hypothetical protein
MRFTKKQGEKFEKKLLSLGYKKYIQHYKHEDYLYWKSFEREIDEDGDKSKGYSVGFAFYDWSKYPQHQNNKTISVSLEFLLGHNLGVSRMDICVSDDDWNLEKFEGFCKDFYEYFKAK